VPNSFQLDQFVFRCDRPIDTAQQEHIDCGFCFTHLYGIDYRYTTAQGFVSQQLLKNNNLYGYDLPEAYFQLYYPCFAQGLLVTVGRYFSPLDIESALAPQNFLISHSLMYNFDAVTQTGITCAIKFNDYWTLQVGLNTGDDVTPWAKGVHFPTLLALIRWVSCDNNDSIWGGIDSFNGGKFKADHDNLQEFGLVWSHRFSNEFFMLSEFYYIFQRHSPQGGTCIFGPPRSFFENVGCGSLIRGTSSEIGFVNFLEYKICDKEFISLRTDYLNDLEGERTGYQTQYYSFTVGLTHLMSDVFTIRAEGRYELAAHRRPYDNGTKREQTSFLMDIISKF
jgi:hypothetical protein